MYLNTDYFVVLPGPLYDFQIFVILKYFVETFKCFCALLFGQGEIIMTSELSPQVQNQVAQIQQVQQQAQTLSMQKSQTDIMLKETQMAVEELEKASDDAVVYKSVGELMIKSEKTVLLSTLKERLETLSLRIQSIDRQEERLNARYRQLQEQLQNMMSGSADS
jgi:prefoldin beta subunit